MKKTVIAMIAASILAFASCSTTGFAGLATESYAAEIDQKTQAELAELRTEIAKMRALADELEAIIADVDKLKKELKEYDDKLDTVPRETIEKLAAILDEYLGKTR